MLSSRPAAGMALQQQPRLAVPTLAWACMHAPTPPHEGPAPRRTFSLSTGVTEKTRVPSAAGEPILMLLTGTNLLLVVVNAILSSDCFESGSLILREKENLPLLAETDALIVADGIPVTVGGDAWKSTLFSPVFPAYLRRRACAVGR